MAGDDNKRPFKDLPKKVPLKKYSEEGKIFIEYSGVVQNGIPYIFTETGTYSQKYKLLEFSLRIFFLPMTPLSATQYNIARLRTNVYEEIIADGNDKISVSQNTQEIRKSLFAERIEKKTITILSSPEKW